MSTCEQYARATAKHPTDPTLEATVGVELRMDDDVDELAHEVMKTASIALCGGGGNHVEVVALARDIIRARWPDRAFFVETEETGLTGTQGVQVYQPFGMPREKCAACGGKLCG